MKTEKRRIRVFSGIQPSGSLHLGNYLGAIRQWVIGQSEKDNYFCIVDLHAITVYQNPQLLAEQTLSTAAVYMAAGVDARQSTLFVQSHVPAHTECCWVLNCVTPLGWLRRMTQFKTKAVQPASISAGLLNYPVLQAADILLYDADEVPVGEDQRQHVELARDIASRFNHTYGDTFVLPEAVVPEAGGRVRGFNDPEYKMSKSLAHIPGHAVGLLDDPDRIRATIRQAVTDSGQEIIFSENPEKAGVNNQLGIYQLLTGMDKPEIVQHFMGKGYRELKNELSELVIEALRPIRKEHFLLMSDRAEIERILSAGADRAKSITARKMQDVRRKVGFLPG